MKILTCIISSLLITALLPVCTQAPSYNDWYWESIVNLHIDNHSRPVGKGFTIEELTDMVRDIPVTMIQVSALGNPGVQTTFPSEILPNSGGDWDTPGAWKQVADNLGRKFCIYMNSLGLHAAEEHPEWMRRKADGSGYPQRKGFRMCVKKSPDDDGFLDKRLLPIVKEVMTTYMPDGIWMDGDWNIKQNICWCHNCKKVWELKTGKTAVPVSPDDPDWPAWLRLHIERINDYHKIVADAVHEINPACMYSSNGGWRLGANPDVDPNSAPEYTGTYTHDLSRNNAMNRSRVYSMALSPERETPHDIMHLITAPDEQITLPRLRQEAGLTMAGGSAWFMWVSGATIVNESAQERAKTCAEFVRERNAVLGRTYSQNPVAVLSSETSWEREFMDGKDDYYEGRSIDFTAMALQDAHFGVDIPNEHILHSGWSNYRTIVVPNNQREIQPHTLLMLEGFAESGGTLIVMGSGMQHAEGKEDAIEALLGVKRTGAVDGTHTLNMGDKNVSFESAYDVEPAGAEVLVSYENGKPFLIKNTVGKGAAVYVNSPTILYPDNKEVISWIMDRLGVKPLVQIESGDKDRHIVFYLRSKPGRLILHVINLTSHSDGERIVPNSSNSIDPVAVISRLTMNLKLPAQPQEVSVVPSASNVEFSWNGGTLNLTLTNLDYHAAVEMTIDGHYSR